jgi:hypothetical protein
MLESKYSIEIPDPGYWMGIRDRNRGLPLLLAGKVEYVDAGKDFRISGNSKSFSGNVKFILRKNRFELNAKECDVSKFFRIMHKVSPVRKSSADVSIVLNNLDAPAGNFDFKLKGTLKSKQTKRLYNVDIGSDLPFNAKGGGRIRGGVLSADMKFESSKVKLDIKNARYSVKDGKSNGGYILDIPDLGILRPMTGQRYFGNLRVNGTFDFKKRLILSGHTGKWGGRQDFTLDGDLLKLKIKKSDLPGMFKTFGHAPIIEASADASMRYNTLSRKGKLRIETGKGRFVQNNFIVILGTILHRDPHQLIFERAVLDADILKDVIVFDFHTESDKLTVHVSKGRINHKRKTVDAIVAVKDGKKIYRIRLQGPVDHPKITPILSDIVVEEAGKLIKKKGLDKKLEKVIPKELKGVPVEKLIKHLF